MAKLGEPLNQTYEDSGFDEFMGRPFEGLEATREWEKTGYLDEDLVANMEDTQSKNFTTTIVFSSDDFNTATWAEGVIEYQDSKVTPTIAVGTTGNMTARTYIYYDPQASKVALQTTTTAATATKGERVVVAIAVPDGDETKLAEVQTFGATGMFIGDLKDGSSTTLIDATGLVSTASFAFDSIQPTANQTTSSLTWADIANASLDLTLSRTARVLIMATANLQVKNSTPAVLTYGAIAIDIEGDKPDPVIFATRDCNGSVQYEGGGQGTHTVQELSSGSHTIKLQWLTDNANTTLKLYTGTLTYLVLGV